ncbi:MAG TPA: hypothetical protein VLB86_11920 [Gaiellaceae bacterium]|nr:hypothetical protein [Gaiellaceae bacterium]
MTAPGFGDRVRICDTEEMHEHGFAGRVGKVFGESVPSSSGAGPIIGDRGEDFALSVFFDDTDEHVWFAPHLVEFVDRGGEQTMSLDGGPSYTRDADGVWQEVGRPTELGELLNPGRRVPRVANDAAGAVRRWLNSRRR